MKFDPNQIRRTILNMAYSGATVHVACAFSITELLAVLYRNHLRFPDNDPQHRLRDYMVLSKGHGVMAQYACVNELGWIGDEEISSYFKNGTRLKGLADTHVPGIEVTSGTLGHGLSIAAGLALAAKLSITAQECYCIVGDGEINEGSIWEAALFASHFKLDNLTVIVDKNGFQAMGTTDEVLTLGNIEAKFLAFGFDAITIDGHAETAIDATLDTFKANKNGKPKAIIATTIKGRGVDFMENDNIWHYTRLNQDTFKAALSQLNGENE